MILVSICMFLRPNKCLKGSKLLKLLCNIFKLLIRKKMNDLRGRGKGQLIFYSKMYKFHFLSLYTFLYNVNQKL